MHEANEQLAHALASEPEGLDIENVEEGRPHIEMDLACGVLDLKDEQAVSLAERSLRDGRPAKELPPGSPDASSSSDDEDDEGVEGDGDPMSLEGEAASGIADVTDGQQKDSQGGGQKGRRRAGIVELHAEKDKPQDTAVT